MKVDHICNANLLVNQKDGIEMKNPKTGKVTVVRTADDVIKFNTDSMVLMDERKKTHGESPAEKAAREATVKAFIEKIKAKKEKQDYLKLTENIPGFEHQNDRLRNI